MCYVKRDTPMLPSPGTAYNNIPSTQGLSLDQLLLGLGPNIPEPTMTPLLTPGLSYALSFPQGTINCSPPSSLSHASQEHPLTKEEELVLRRKRNTEAARRSRMRKQEKMDTMSHEVERLDKEKRDLLVEVGVLRRECELYAQRERDMMARIRELENKLFKQ
jgi:hypothetical protein